MIPNARSWFLVTIAAVAACHGHAAAPSIDGFTAVIAPPAPLDRLAIGMTAADATGILPQLVKPTEDGGPLTIELGEGVHGRIDLEGGRVHRVSVSVDRSSFERELAARWGAARPRSPGIVEWTGPKWLASHACTDAGDRCTVRFDGLPRPLTAAFFGKTPAPPGVLARLTPGMPIADARAIAPALLGPSPDNDLGVDDVTADVVGDQRDAGGVLLKLGISLRTSALELVRAAWGPERSDQDYFPSSGPRQCWLGDPWRACIARTGVDRTHIELDRHVGLATLLGDGDSLGVAVRHGWFGATRAQLEAANGPLALERLVLPNTEYGGAHVDLEFRADQVIGIKLWLNYNSDEARAALYQQLAHKWGAATAVPPRAKLASKPVLLHAHAPRVEVTEGTDRTQVLPTDPTDHLAYGFSLAISP